jgi:thiol reductant ABC exporter CydC subunit
VKGTLGRLLGLVRPFARHMLWATLLGLATVGSGIGLMTTSGYLIARAALQPSIADLQIAIVGVRFFGIARGLFRYLERYVSHEATFRLLARLRVWFYSSLEPLAPARTLQYRSGDLLARIVADVGTLENIYLRAIAPPVVAILVAVLVTILLAGLNGRLAVPFLVSMLLGGLGLPLLSRTLSRGSGRKIVHVHAELDSLLIDGIQGVADLLAFGQEERHLAHVRGLSSELGRLQVRMASIGGLQNALAGLLMNLGVVAMLVIAVPLVSSGRLDGLYLALLVLAVMSAFEAVLPLPQALQYLETSLEAARRLFEIVDAQPACTDPPSPLSLSQGCDLRVEKLTFAYGPGEAPALSDISFDLPRGKHLAVVGPSGAGKTTLGHLLLRFWDYQQGHILINEQELRRYRQQELRRLMAVVSQRTHLFNATVRENLLLSRPDASQDEVEQATKQAQIHDFIQSLPQGYDTPLGEQGILLSAGQRQRLAIARAILQDAPILILDEPTANLDALTEREVMSAVQALLAGRTALMISHRLSGLEDWDEILVLRAGRIVERGRHYELMQMGGLYRRMWALQNESLEGKACHVGQDNSSVPG